MKKTMPVLVFLMLLVLLPDMSWAEEPAAIEVAAGASTDKSSDASNTNGTNEKAKKKAKKAGKKEGDEEPECE